MERRYANRVHRGVPPWRALGAWIVLTLAAVPATAQTTPAPLTLQAAMDRAFAANPTISAARLRGAVNVAALSVARERLNPEASIEIERERPKQAFAFAVPIELGGQRDRRIEVGEATIRAGEAEVAATLAQVRNDVRRAYYGVLVADARLALMREIRDLSTRARDTAQTRFDAGDAPRLEVMQAALGLASAENEATAAEGVARAARTQLNAVLGMPLDATPVLTTAIDEGMPPTAESAASLARTASAELAVFDRRIDEQRARIALAHALRGPVLIPTGTLVRDNQPEFDYGWRAGVSVTLPIFTTHSASVVVEETTLDQLNAERQAALLRITGEVTAAAVTADTQRQLYTRYRDQILPQALQVEQLAQDAYQLGQTGVAALLQALQATRDVRLRSLDAVSQLQIALADLERAIGAPLP